MKSRCEIFRLCYQVCAQKISHFAAFQITDFWIRDAQPISHLNEKYISIKRFALSEGWWMSSPV